MVTLRAKKYPTNSQLLLLLSIFLFAIYPLWLTATQRADSHDTSQAAIRVGLTKPIETTLPIDYPWPSTRTISAAVHRGLHSTDGDGRPLLVESIPTLDNGGVRYEGTRVTITYHLRNGLRWSDGRAVTSSDVKFTFDFMEPVANTAGSQHSAVERIDTPDDRTVVVTTRPGRPLVDLDRLLSGVVLPEHVLRGMTKEDLDTSIFPFRPVGLGPYVVTEWRYVGETSEYDRSGVKAVSPNDLWPAIQVITLEANPFFAGRRPASERIIVSVIPDERRLIEEFISGTIDIVSDDSLLVSLEEIDRIQIDGVVATAPGFKWERLDFNLQHPALADSRVRKAIAHAINRERLVNEALGAFGSVMSSWLPSSHWAHTPVLQEYTYDPGYASHLLSEAGYVSDKDGFASRNGQRLMLTLYVATGNDVRWRVANLIRDDLRNIGISVIVRPIAAEALLGPRGLLASHIFDLALFSWEMDIIESDAINLWHSASIPSISNNWHGDNFSGWTHPANDSLLEKSAAAHTLTERFTIYHRQQELFASFLPVLPLFEYQRVALVSSRIEGFSLLAGQMSCMWNVEEWRRVGNES